MHLRLARSLAAGMALALAATAQADAADKCAALRQVTSLEMHSLAGGGVTVDMALDGRPSHLLFDTGGGVRTLTPEVVAALGLRTYPANITIVDLAGRSQASEVIVPSLTLGGVTVPKVKFMVAPKDSMLQHFPGVDGLFAPDLMHNVDYDLDFAGHTLRIFMDDHCPGSVVYWPADAVAVVPFTMDSTGHMKIQVKVDGATLDADLDTGAVGTTLDLSIAKGRFDVDLNAPDVKPLGELRAGHPIYGKIFKTLSFGGITVANPAMALLPNLQPDETRGTRTLGDHGAMPAVLLGMNILSKLHVYIATKEHKIYITPGSAPDARVKAVSADASP